MSIKQHAMNTNVGMEIQIHEYFTLPLNENIAAFTLRLIYTRVKSPA
jgi:hypothetical protein